jgi:6-phosphogluconolactonase (cycloisomerase 2 family)
MASKGATATFLLALSILSVVPYSSAVVQQTAAAGNCGSTLLAIGSFTTVDMEPALPGEGVTLLNLTLCSDSTGELSSTLIEDRLIPVNLTGENPGYCDEYAANKIICCGGVDTNGTATMLTLTEPTATAQMFNLGTSKLTHCTTLYNGKVAAASYGGSTFLTFDPISGPRNAPLSGVKLPAEIATMAAGDAERQKAPHPHQVLEVADGELLIPDLGSDAVYHYNVSQNGTLVWAGATTVPPGSGPRHGAAGPGGKVYVVAELALQLIELGSGCTLGAEGAARGVCSTKNVTATFLNSTFTSGAAVRVSRDQKFVYMSLREEEGTPDLGGIVGFPLTANGSLGESIGTWSSGGQHPRDFNLVEIPGFKEVFVIANLRSNSVLVFDRDAGTGVLGKQLASAVVNSPVSVLPIGVEDGLSAAAAPSAASSAPQGAPGNVASSVAPGDRAEESDTVTSGGGATAGSSGQGAVACAAGQTLDASGACMETSAQAADRVAAAGACMIALYAAFAISLIGLGW